MTDDLCMPGDVYMNSPYTPAELTAMASDPHEWVRAGVARSPGTPPAVLTALASDPHWDVRRGVARSPGAPPAVLTALASDPHEWVRQGVAGNPGTPPDVLATLAGNPLERSQVRAAAIENPSTPEEAAIIGALLNMNKGT